MSPRSWMRFSSGMALVALAACSGGGGGGDHGGGPSGTKTGIVVDPYVTGAVLVEAKPTGEVVQESSPSGAKGVFTFAQDLTPGNRVFTVLRGLHAGVPYSVALSARVEADRPVVVSPLTSLVASNGFTVEQVASLVNQVLPGTPALTADDVRADPIARMLDGEVTDADRRLLAADLSVGAALAMRRGDASGDALAPIVTHIAPKVLAALSREGSPEAVGRAAAAVAGHIASVARTDAEATAAAAAITDAVLGELVTTAATDKFPVLTSSGALAVGAATVSVPVYLAQGHAALDRFLGSRQTDDLLAAANAFSAAAALIDSASPQQKDEAYFFSALARLVALVQPYTDATDDGLNDAGDLLDAFGLGGTPNDGRGTVTKYTFLDCPTESSCSLKSIPNSAPRGRALQAFAASQVAAGLRSAVARFDQVSSGFAGTVRFEGKTVELDAADVALARTVARSMLAATELQYAYDLDVNLAELQTKLPTGGGESKPAPVRALARLVTAPARALAGDGGEYDKDAFLADHPSFLRLVDAPRLQQARADALAACTSALAALDALQAETDDQSDDLFHIGEDCTYDSVRHLTVCTPVNSPRTLAEMRSDIGQVKDMLSASGNYTFNTATPDTSDDVTVNPGKFFAGIDGRAMLPSTFRAGVWGDAPGMLPDPTLGGVLVSPPAALSTDADQDGSPDFFGYSYLSAPYLAGRTFASNPHSSGALQGTWTFAASGNGVTFDGSTIVGGGPGTDATYAATYAVADHVLTITFDGAGVSGIKAMAISSDEVEDTAFDGSVEYRNDQGQILAERWHEFWLR